MDNNMRVQDNRSMNYVYDLYICFDSLRIPVTCIEKYKKNIDERNKLIASYISGHGGYPHIDAGFDLFVPKAYSISANQISQKIYHEFKAAMYLNLSPHVEGVNRRPVAYYLYPRSSMGAKTPLRLSNSVGIIDSGYRGNIIGLVDNVSGEDYSIKMGDRLLQICAPNLSYPIRVIVVDDVLKLGSTQRDEGGFGSTGR